MATATREHGQRITDVVRRARSTIYLSRLLLGVAAWLLTTAAVWLVLFALDNLFRLPGGLRFPLGIVAMLITIGSLWSNVLRRLLQRPTAGGTALLLERKYGIGENVLINSLQFSELEFDDRQRPFVEETIGAGTGGLAAVSLRDLWQPGQLVKWGVLVAVAIALWIGYAALAPRHVGNALARYLFPLADVPPVASIELLVAPGDDQAIAEGDDVRVNVKIVGLPAEQRLESYPELFWKEGDAVVEAQPAIANRVVMQPVVGKTNVYTHKFIARRRDLAFRVFARDAYSKSIQLTVHPAPRIAESTFKVTSPDYIGSTTSTVMGPPQSVSALPGSGLHIEIKLDQAAKSLRWKTAGEVLDFAQKDNVWRAKTKIDIGGPYEVEVERAGLPRPIQIANGVISLLADRPPQVEFIQPVMSWTVLPGERVPLHIRAEDDQGAKEIAVTVKSAFGGGSLGTVKTWKFPPPGQKGSIEERMDLTIDAALFVPGSRYLVEAACSDFCPDNSPAISRPVLIEVKAVDKLEMPADAKLADIYAALDRAIMFQKKALDASRILSSHIDEVWLGVSGQPRLAEEVQKLLAAHRTQILGNQRQVRALLVAAKGDARLAKRMRELGDREATQANDRSFTLTLPSISSPLKPVGEAHPPAAGRQEVSFPLTDARYLALVAPLAHGWQDKMLLQNLELLNTYATGGPKNQLDAAAKTAANRGGALNQQTWQTAGPAPYYVVIDLGKTLGLSRVAFTSTSEGPRELQVFVSKDAPALAVKDVAKPVLAAEVAPLERLQETIYNELVGLKGQEAKKAAKEKEDLAKKALGESIEAAPTVQDAMKKFGDELKDWTKEHKKNAEKRKSIMDKPAQDFSDHELNELSKLNLEKRQQARRLEDMVHDLSNSGAMDFGDPSMAKTLAKMMADAKDLKDLENVAAKKAEELEYTFNLDTAITSKAEEITKGTEDTTHVTPTPGSSENPEDKKNLPYLQQLPTELAVTVPPLKQKLDDLYEKIKQAGMSLANTKNATEGPIGPSTFSGASAQGKMGDATPDPKMDRSGRSNAGRTGKSDGQMVGSMAPAIPDEEILIPERMSNTPLDAGKDVDDQSGNDPTSTGLGKSTNGLTEFARTGLLPPGLEQKMRSVLREAEDVRSTAHELVLKLQRHNLPTADLRMALYRLDQAKEAMKRGDGIAIRAACNDSVRHLQTLQKTLEEAIDRRQTDTDPNNPRQRNLAGRGADSDPRGYEEIIGAYFRQIAEQK